MTYPLPSIPSQSPTASLYIPKIITNKIREQSVETLIKALQTLKISDKNIAHLLSLPEPDIVPIRKISPPDFEDETLKFKDETLHRLVESKNNVVVEEPDCSIELYHALEDHENELRLLRHGEKNDHFASNAAQYMMGLLKREEYQKWILLCPEFTIYTTTPEFHAQCEEAIFGCLNRPYTLLSLTSIFCLLKEVKHPNALLWSSFFQAVKQSNQNQLKSSICTLLSEDERFPGLWKQEAAVPLTQALYIAESIPNLEAAYDLLNRHLVRILNHDAEILLSLLQLLSNVCKQYKNELGKKEALIKQIIPFLSKIDFKDTELQWKTYRLLINACRDTKDHVLILARVSMIYQLLKTQKFGDRLRDTILLLLKTWPNRDFTTVAILLPTGLSPGRLLNELTRSLHASADGVFIEQYENLIQNSSEVVQLIAIRLYKLTLLNLYIQTPDKNTSALSKPKLLKLAFQSPYLTVIKEALATFYKKQFQEDLQSDAIFPYCEFIIQALVKIPIESYKEASTHEFIYNLFLTYAGNYKNTKNKSPVAKYFEYFTKSNDELLKLSGNGQLYGKNHWAMFFYTLKLAESNRLDLSQSNENDLLPHLYMLKNCCKALFNDNAPEELAALICHELTSLFESTQNQAMRDNRDLFGKHMEFILDIMYINNRCLFVELFKGNADAAFVASIKYLENIKYMIDNLERKADIIEYAAHCVKTDFIVGTFTTKISEERKLIYCKKLFPIIQFLEMHDPACPIYMLFLGKVTSIEPVDDSIRDRLIDLIGSLTKHYKNLYFLNKNKEIIINHMLPSLKKKLDSL
ncbi:MAG: hypothetical protein JSR46_02700 [Verrucomicrobia bacterium]|nr:hypothetical protein [Verrucomicrobiota bacterium]